MTIGALLSAFAHDEKVAIALLLVAVDFILGAGAAVQRRTFALSYVADVLHRDVLGKLFPFFVVYAADLASHGAGLVGPIDFGQVSGAAYGLLVAALAGSIISSLGDFGLSVPAALGRGEVPPPGP